MVGEVKITGVKELVKTLRALPRSMRRKVYMKSLRAGMEVVRKQASDNLLGIASNEATGTAAKNVRVYSARKYRGAYRVLLMIRRGAFNKTKIVNGQPVRVGLYASVLEYGKANQRPRPWIRSAIERREGEAQTKVAETMRGLLDTAVNEAKR